MGAKNDVASKINEFLFMVKNGMDIENYYIELVSELERVNRKLNMFLKIRSAKECLSEIKKLGGKQLSYFPYSAKDNICTEGIETTAGSKILKGYIPPFDATVIEKMKRSGAVLLGKTNMDEFGFGTFSINSAFSIPRNPYNTELCAGGSSGGAGVATAVIEYHVAIAVSTGGSISCPAAFNGVVGLTPTYGSVSRWGLIDYANSLDKIGVMGKYTKDVEIIFNIIAGIDKRDPTTNKKKINSKAKGIRIFIPENIISGCNKTIAKSFWNAIEKLTNEYGIEYRLAELPILQHAVPAYYIIATCEASTNLARFCGMRYGMQEGSYDKYFDEYFTDARSSFFGKEAKRRIILGTFARMAGYRNKYYLKALKVRGMIIGELKNIFKRYDIIATPTMPITAPPISLAEKLSPIETYMLDMLTIPPNLAGMPHISLPIAYKDSPIGMQFIANHYAEELLFHMGKLWESIFKYKPAPIRVGVIK